mmetsp:Transcript_27085/g.68312  ORF Transcript_27085/g.68312 Transcript_27085/m.68312 type:complete len:218 (-) Transcript_27085:1230-1883(-)
MPSGKRSKGQKLRPRRRNWKSRAETRRACPWSLGSAKYTFLFLPSEAIRSARPLRPRVLSRLPSMSMPAKRSAPRWSLLPSRMNSETRAGQIWGCRYRSPRFANFGPSRMTSLRRCGQTLAPRVLHGTGRSCSTSICSASGRRDRSRPRLSRDFCTRRHRMAAASAGCFLVLLVLAATLRQPKSVSSAPVRRYRRLGGGSLLCARVRDSRRRSPSCR